MENSLVSFRVMKQRIYGKLLIAFIIPFVFSSCKNDYCPDGYYGANCDIYDSCANINCYHGGICKGGVCDCPDGYAGVNCETILAPDSILVTKIELSVFPTQGEEPGWDLNDPPDVFVTINEGLKAKLSGFQSSCFTDSYAPLVFTSEQGLPTCLTRLTETYTVGAWDVDDDGSFLMDQKHFIPMANVEGFPEKIHLTWPGWSCWLYVEWKF